MNNQSPITLPMYCCTDITVINITTTNTIFLSRPRSEIKIQNKKVTNEDDNTSLSYLFFLISLINIMFYTLDRYDIV